MNPWLHDPSPNPMSHAGFGPSVDGPMSFLQPPQTINPAQFQNQPYLNGAGRTASPAFHNPVYQTNPVIPSKRSREDSLGTSPRQAPGGLPGSRSQTPGQGPYPGYNPHSNGAPPMSNAPTPFQHLQTSNATPSPTIQQMNFNQPGGPQRVSTASPSPFSPQHGPPHPSPGPSDHNSRVGTPHDNAQHFMPNANFNPGFSQHQFGPNISNGIGQVGLHPPANMNPQQQGMSAAQRAYQMQLQVQERQMQARQMQAQAQARTTPNQNQHTQMPPAQAAAFNPPRASNPEEFIKGLQTFMAARGRTVDLNPVICARPVPLMRLYVSVVKAGGSSKISKMGQWPLLAQQFGFPQPQQAQAAQEMQNYWMTNLAPYEAAWQASQQKQRMAAQAAIQNQMQNQMSPTRDTHPSQDATSQGHQRSQSDVLKVNAQMQQQAQQSMLNGFSQSPNSQNQQEPSATPQHRSSLSRQLDPSQLAALQAQVQPGPSPQKRPESSAGKSIKLEPDSTVPIRKPIEDPFEPDVHPQSRYHGPINVEEIYILGQHLSEAKPIVPNVRELGIIDIHALTMAIKSGMHAETRVALDTLVTLSTESTQQLSLVDCDDLMDTLIDCAQDQVDFLMEQSAEVSDEMLLTSYEELVRACRVEAESLQDVPEFGTVAYDLDKAADRLICITTLIRNFSFYEANFVVLGQPEVLRLLSSVIRCLGTKEMLLRSHRNTLDFMKDVIIYLSNLSTSLNLPGKEEALCLLHFLLTFAPAPPPTSGTSDKVTFTMYTPTLHKYLPSAVDSLAKLLARDEPNRTYYKAIFAADSNSTPAYELLTKTFALAIAAIPGTGNNLRAVVEARKPFLLQGMLAAEILAVLAPSSEHTLARSWLESDDGFAGNLLRLVSLLSSDRGQAQRQPPNPQGRSTAEQDPNAYGAITARAMAVLKTLVQKSRTVNEEGLVVLPKGVLPRKESLLGAMIQKDIDPGVLRQLCVYAGLED